MDKLDKQMFAKTLQGLGDIYGKAITAEAIKIYYRCLKNYETLGVIKAFESHISSPDNGQFFPNPADVIKLIDGDSESQSLVAWSKLDRAIRQIGVYQSVRFDDKKIHAVVGDMGGWTKFGRALEKDMPFLQIEFIKRYSSLDEDRDYPERITGLTEMDCVAQQLSPPQPVFIGDENTDLGAGVLEVENKKAGNNRVREDED